MYTSYPEKLANSYKKWSVAHSKPSNDMDQPGLGTPIALTEPARQDWAEQIAQAEHRRSFS
jgi:hypothetical protein